MPIKLLIADDERLFRQSLKILLETATDIKVVADAGNGQEAVTAARETAPDLALLDVDMPRMDGIKAARLIGAVSPRTKLLMLSVHHEDDKINAALRAGACGYVLKDTDRDDFIKIIRQTHAGKVSSSPYLAHLALDGTNGRKLNPAPARATTFAAHYGLTELELKILRLVTEGLSNEEIGTINQLARETVKGHLKSLFRKLNVKNRTEAAVLAVREGTD
ncbi:MAG TPA: response regulator transcription factor [Candidatus Binatia bacterium]|nr:response regulator transcription factor [Candidatus Binatia bacterium]